MVGHHDLRIAVSMHRRGVSMLEMVVVITVLGILMSILLPAVQSSREQARRLQCVNNLRQIGIGMSHHAEQKGVFPTKGDVFVEMLPYLELAEMHRQFKAATLRPPFPIPWISCPSDPLVDRQIAQPSYLVNDGTRLRVRSEVNGFRKSDVMNTRPSEVTDGLSQTAAFSERLAAPHSTDVNSMLRQPRRYFLYTEKRFARPGQEEQAIDQCRFHRTTPFPQFFELNALGLMSPGVGYDHMLPPNHPGCFNGPEDFELNVDHALIPASSLHIGGVNVLYADGSVHYVSDTVDLDVWRSLGTRSGAEAIPAPE